MENNFEELFIWNEVIGDLYLIIQLLLIKGDRNDLLDNAKQSLKYYKDSRDKLKVFAKPGVGYGVIYGLPYQINFFEPLLKSNGFEGYSQSCLDKMEFIEKELLKKEGGWDYLEYRDSPFFDNKTILNNRIEKLIEKVPQLNYRGYDLENWKNCLYFIHDNVLNFNYNQRNLNNLVTNWNDESDMQKWMQSKIESLLLLQNNEPSFYSGREIKVGGGSCDHYYKKIPICDKWKRDTNARNYPLKINDFRDKVYTEHYEQLKSYAHDIKLAIMVVIDSRDAIRKKSPDLIKDCYEFKVNEQDGVITAIFIIQVTDITPSRR